MTSTSAPLYSNKHLLTVLSKTSRKSSALLAMAALLILPLAIVLVAPSQPANAFDGVGNGSSNFPYQITTCPELQAINDNVGATYALASNIDCSGSSAWNGGLGFVPLGAGGTPFAGTLDGRNHVIQNLYENNTSDDDGLFAFLDGATVKNLSFTGISITTGTSNEAAAGLAGVSTNSTISNVYVTGNIIGGSNAGGLIGEDTNGMISSSSMTGSVTAVNGGGGGFLGTAAGTAISNSFANVTVTGSQVMGGFIGETNENSGGGNSITNSYAVGTVNASSYFGSFIGLAIGGSSLNLIMSGNFVNVTSFDTSSAPQAIKVFGLSQNVQVSDMYFDQTSSETSNCGSTAPSDCIAVNSTGTDSSYFLDNNDVDPMDNWDFNHAWHTHAGQYPQIRNAALSPASLSSPTAPDAPSNVQVNPGTGTDLSVSWDTPSDGGSDITGYTVEYKLDGTNTWTDVQVSSSPYTITGFSIGDSVDVQIIATNNVGNSSPGTASTYNIPSNNVANITACQQLQAIQEHPDHAYTLANDIDCSDTVNWNAGAGFVPIAGFTGSLDGNGHTISNMTINLPSGNPVGMFADIDASGSVSNLNTDNFSITGYRNVGTIVGTLSGGTIDTVYAGDNYVAGQDAVGGLVGHIDAENGHPVTVTNSSDYSDVVVADPTNSATELGGAIGLVYSGGDTVTLGNITTNGTVGVQSTGDTQIGGVVGAFISDNAGQSTISQLQSNATVYGNGQVGGVVGLAVANDTSNITFSDDIRESGNVTCDSDCGGLVGDYQTTGSGTSSITEATASGTITATGDNAGGLIGYTDGPVGSMTLEDSFSTGSVSSNGNAIGGLVGHVDDQSMDITDTYATGNVTGTNSVGGLVGVTTAAVTHSYASGQITGSENFAGLVGDLAPTGSIEASFATGFINWQDADFGAVAGNDTSGTLSDNRYDATTTGQSNCEPSGDVTGCDAANVGNTAPGLFNDNNSVDPLATWDFTNTWVAQYGILPTFQWAPGTPVQPSYPTITDCQQLQAMQNNLSGNYTLANDIDCSDTINWNGGEGFEPVGVGFGAFTGTFNGSGYTISGLYINRPNNYGVGLFGITHGASVDNVTLTDGSITGDAAVGTLVGIAVDTSINDVSSNTPVSATSGLAGGLIGYIYVDDGSDETFTDLTHTGDVTALSNGGDYVGGVVGKFEMNAANADDQIAVGNWQSSGTVTAESGDSVGGLIGALHVGATSYQNFMQIQGLTTSATIDGADSNDVGGAIGDIDNVDGGIIFDTISASGAVSGGDYTGGLFGQYSSQPDGQFADETGNIMQNLSASGNVTSTGSTVGGLIGSYASHSPSVMELSDSSATGNVTVTGGGQQVGGLIGYTLAIQQGASQIEHVFSTGTVSSDGDYVGGLIGFQDANLDIHESYSQSNVTGDENVGGLVGAGFANTIDAYASGSVTGNDLVGGLVGYESYQLQDDFSAGAVNQGNAATLYGGLVGWLDSYSGATLSNNYYDAARSGQTDCAGAFDDSECLTDGLSVNATGTDPNYFFANDSNAPVDTWDFSSGNWIEHANTYPTFTTDAPEAQAAQITATSTSTSITPTWDFPVTGGSPITSYTVRYALASAPNTWITVTLASPTDLTVEVDGLLASTSYIFEVSATSNEGTSAWVSFTASTQAATVVTPTPTPVIITTSPATVTSKSSTGSTPVTTFSSDEVDGGSPVDASQATASPTSILLNNYDEYNNGQNQGKLESLQPNQIVYFMVGAQTHSVTVDNVGTNYVVFTIRSTPQQAKLMVGQTRRYSVNGSKTNVIQVTLASITNGVANMRFKRVLPATSTVSSSPNYAMLYWLAVATVLILAIYVIAKKRHRKDDETSK